ncbi:MAG: HD domain-containing protein [Atopobiaceae bacterium]|nr:HD domain-containing protein [Atopobiaceae bacterium]
MYMDEALEKDIMDFGTDIIASERFAKAIDVPHHSKDGNIAAHSLETAGIALRLTRWLNRHGASIDEVTTVRAGLLHDIGMTEDEVFLSPSREKGHTHPLEGARIAREEFGADDAQLDAILHHMWPVCCLTPPHTSEGWVVTAADKLCSLNEVRSKIRQLL